MYLWEQQFIFEEMGVKKTNLLEEAANILVGVAKPTYYSFSGSDLFPLAVLFLLSVFVICASSKRLPWQGLPALCALVQVLLI